MDPFGSPDGSRGPFETQDEFIVLPRRYGPIGRPVAEQSRVRVVAGRQGVGKTLFLRRMQAYFERDGSVFSTPPTLKARQLDTESVITFSQLFSRTTNTERWSNVWDRAIHLSAATYLLRDARFHGAIDEDIAAQLRSLVDNVYPSTFTPRNPVEVAARICRTISSDKTWRAFMDDDNWVEIAKNVQSALERSRELYLFIDAIDDNYRYAPTYWQHCQRGLFHAVMDTQRTETESSKLHVVISVRDLTLSSIARSEHATRYLDAKSVASLDWSLGSCTEFLNEKLLRIAARHFPDRGSPRILSNLLGRERIFNVDRKLSEDVSSYFLRHTRMCPRDIITLGNALVAGAEKAGRPLAELDDSALRAIVGHEAKQYARSALAQAGNQVLSNVMPWSASKHHFLDFYLAGDEYTADAMVREFCSVLLHAETEEFGEATREHLEEEAERRFGQGCHFIDVLWQHRLIGVRQGGRLSFYRGALEDETSPPTSRSYHVNSLLIPLLPGVRLSPEARPGFPGAEDSHE